MYLSSSLSFSLFCFWSGHVFSSLWSNVSMSKVSKIALWRCSLNIFFNVIVSVFLVVFLLVRSCFLITLVKCLRIAHWRCSQKYLSLSLSLPFCWSGHVFSSLCCCLKGQKTHISLFEGVLLMNLSLSLSLSSCSNHYSEKLSRWTPTLIPPHGAPENWGRTHLDPKSRKNAFCFLQFST